MESTNESARVARARQTREALERIPEIPTLPAVLIKIWDLTSKSDTSANDLADAMQSDPGLTGAVLRLANSAYFGFPRKVSTVTQAVVVLGFETVKSLATGASVFRALNTRGGDGLDPRSFFHHSLVTATAARVLVERSSPQKAGTAFCAGILHDLGKLVIAEFLPDASGEIRQAVARGRSLEEAEADALGLTHAEIGSWFTGRWNFPEELAATVRWHHRPAEAKEHRDYVSAVHLGDVVAHRIGAAGSGPAVAPEPHPAALEELAVDETALEEITNIVAGMVKDPQEVGLTLGT
jgi:HD-like signal output (HDOD) protein